MKDLRQKKRGFLFEAVVYGVGGTAAPIVAAVLLPLYTHFLDPEDFGSLDLLQRTGSIVVLLLMGNGIRAATFSFYCQARSERERQQTFSTLAVVLWTLLLVGGIAGALGSPWIARLLQISDHRLVTLGIIVVLLESFGTFPMSLLQARMESIHFVAANATIATCRMLLIIVGVVGLGLGVWGVLYASAITFLVAGLIMTAIEASRGFPAPDREIAHDVIKYAIPLLPAGLLALAITVLDRYFLVVYGGTREVGLYALGAKLAISIPSLAIAPLWKVWTAALYDYYEADDAHTRVGRIVFRILAVQVFLAFGVSVFNHEIVQIVAPGTFAAAGALIPWMAVAGTLQLANNLFEGAFWSQRITKWKPMLVACSAGVAVVAFSVLVPLWGSLGAAMALVLAYAVQSSLTFVVTQKIFPVHYDLRSALVGLGLVLVLFLTSQLLGRGFTDIATKLGLWLAWPVLLWICGVLTGEEQRWIGTQVARVRRLAGKWIIASMH